MGGETSKENKSNEWSIVERKDNFNVVKDNKGNTAHQYEYVLDNRFDPDHQAFIFQKRKTLSSPVVKNLQSNYVVKGTTLKPQNHFTVLTEPIPHLLQNAPQLSFPQSLYVLRQSLTGFQQLYNEAGEFSVNGSMIGFTPQGQTKVWLNQNFGSNHPSHERSVLQSSSYDTNYFQKDNHRVCFDETTMVRNIVDVVQQKCETGIYPFVFSSKIKSPGLSFAEAKAIVQETSTQDGLIIPDHIDLVTNKIKTKITRGSIGNRIIKTEGQEYSNYVDYKPTSMPYNYKPLSGNTVITSNSKIPFRNSNFLFQYITPKEKDHPSIFASRLQYK